MEPQADVWIYTQERVKPLVGEIPFHLVELLAGERQKLIDQKFQLIPEGGETLTIKDILVEMTPATARIFL